MKLATIIKNNYLNKNFNEIYRDDAELFIKHSKMNSEKFVSKILNLIKESDGSNVFYREPDLIVGANYTLRGKKINNTLPEMDSEQGIEIKLKNGLKYELNFNSSSSSYREDGDFFYIDLSLEDIERDWTQSSNKKINVNSMIDMRFLKDNVESIMVFHTLYEDEECDRVYNTELSLVSLSFIYIFLSVVKMFNVSNIAKTKRFEPKV